MHIKHIHDMIEKLSECAKMELDKGIENVDTKEMGEVAEIIKELSEAEYYAKISKAMDESEYGEDYDYMGAYDEQSRRGYRGQPRDSRGRYMSRRRMGYEEPIHMMTPHMYKEHSPEYYRDMDMDRERLYFTERGNSPEKEFSKMNDSSRNYSESGNLEGKNYSTRNYGNESSKQNSRSENARRGYEESKMMQDGSPESKKKAMENLENYLKELSEDMTELVGKMDSNEKSMVKSKLQMLAQKVQ